MPIKRYLGDWLDKLVWIRADRKKTQKERKAIVTSALENNFTNIILSQEDCSSFQKLGKFSIIQLKNNKIRINDEKESGELFELTANSDMNKAIKLAGKTDYIMVTVSDWKVIPVENLIAAFQKTKTKLLVEAHDVNEVKLFFETLEIGTDGIVFNPKKPNELKKLRNIIDTYSSIKLKLVHGKISKIQSVGMGDRMCIDTCSILNIGEGMLIGSQSNGMFLVHSESVESEYVSARPFRVNAGPVHSYILIPEDKTKYLSDLKSGDEVLVVDRAGKTRTVVLGRVKLEKRPLVMLEAIYQKKKFNIILQNAETIRLISGGKPVSIVELKSGDEVLMRVTDSGRHFGMKVSESISEK
jgi:3-dehydroquinate synthase II